jgi:AsmA family
MKLVRPLLIGLGTVAVLSAAAIAVAFNSGFQTWAARKALAGRPDLKGTIESVSAGLKRVEIRNARIERNGVVLTLPAATAELPLLDAGLSGKILVARLVAKGWVLDLTHVTLPPEKSPGKTVYRREFSLPNSALAASAPAAAAEIFPGIFPTLPLPVDLSLDGVELEGEVILPPMQGHPGARVKVVVSGGGLAAGRQGSFAYDLAANAGAGVAPISAHALHGTLTASMDTPRSFSRVATKAEASVSGTQFPRGVKLNIDAVAAREAAKENYALTLADGDKQIARLQADFPLDKNAAALGKLNGTWKLNLRDADLAPFLLGVALPVFEVVGNGEFETDAAFVETRSSGTIDATADKLSTLKPELGPIGPVRLAANFALASHGDAVRIERLSADFFGAKPVASLRALQAFEFNPVTRELTANPAQDLFGISLQGVPLAWIQPFLAGFTLTGGDVQGEFVASAGKDGLVLRSGTPIAISKLSLAQAGKPLLEAVDLSLNASADYTPQGWQAVVSSFTAKSGAGTLLELEAKAGRLAGKDRPIKATGKLLLNLPATLAQPAAAGAAVQLTAGEAALEFSASLAAKQEIQMKLAVRNLAVDPKLSPEKLPTITSDLRADREANGKIALNLPIVIERAGRRSDLGITGSVTPEKSGYAVDAHLTSDLLVVDDVKILAAPLASGSELSAPTGQNPPRDTAPPWKGITGKITLVLKKVVYSEALQMADVGGTLRIEAGAVKLEGMRAGMGEGEIKASGAVTFDASGPQPYALKLDFAADNFETAPLFRAMDPAKEPTIDCRFNAKSQIGGVGNTLGQLAEQAHGKFELNSKGGVFRGLAAAVPSDKLQSARSALTVVSGFLGDSTGKTIGVAAEIFSVLSQISFDQMSVTAERDPALNFLLKDFSLIAPEVRLGGTGQISYTPGKPILQQALDLRFNLAARGRLGELMAQAKVLNAAKDSLGYTGFSAPIRIGGTLEKTDTSDLQEKLIDLALEKTGIGDKASELLNKILRK